MKTIFRGELERFLSFTIVAAKLSVVTEAIQSELFRTVSDRFNRYEGPLQLSRLYEWAPPAGAAHFLKVAVYSSCLDPGSSIMMTNVADGWSSLAWNLSQRIRKWQMLVLSSANSAIYPINRFTVWKNGRVSRSVMSMKDGNRWKFFQEGTIEPFESPEMYKLKCICDRLTRDALVKYLINAGWDITKDSFWQADGDVTYFDEFKK